MGRVLDIVAAEAKVSDVVVVASALSGVTDALINMAQLAKQQNVLQGASYYSIVGRHFDLVKQLSAEDRRSDVELSLSALLEEVNSILGCVKTLRELSPRTLDLLMSYGEKLSCTLLAKLLSQRGCPAEVCDATKLIETNADFGNAVVHNQHTAEKVESFFSKNAGNTVQVVTGFCGGTADGETTTLGRGGGDFTASIIGGILRASVVEVWTDVDGVLTAHPKVVANPHVIRTMAYEEAMEMSYFGAKVIYAPTMGPVMRAGVPLHIRNTFNPGAQGTLIQKNSEPGFDDGNFKIRAISSVEDVVLVILKGTSMVGVAGTAGRLFSALTREGVNVILISQASSEHSICLAVAPHHAETARKAIESEFDREIERGQVDNVVLVRDLSVLAVVGCRFQNATGLAGLVTTVLGEHDINIVAIAQGSTDLNFSLVVRKHHQAAAITLIHATFFPVPGEAIPTPPRVVHLFLYTASLEEAESWRVFLHERIPDTLESHAIRFKLVGVHASARCATEQSGCMLLSSPDQDTSVHIASSSCMLDRCIDEMEWHDGSEADFSRSVVAHRAQCKQEVIVLDTTQTGGGAAEYVALLQGGAAVLTCNRAMWRGGCGEGDNVCLRHARFFWSLSCGVAGPVAAALLSCRGHDCAGIDTPVVSVRSHDSDNGRLAALHALSGCTCTAVGRGACILQRDVSGGGDLKDVRDGTFEVSIQSEGVTTQLVAPCEISLPSMRVVYRKLIGVWGK